MTWTKIDGAIRDDPRLLKLSRSARLLHVEALTWANDYGTDGEIPAYALPKVTDEPQPAQAAAALTEAGLWTVGPEGWKIVGFLDNQPSAADVERTHEQWKERQRRQRQHRSGDHSLCEPKYCQAASHVTRDNPGDSLRESRHTEPNRTVPNRRVGKGVGERASLDAGTSSANATERAASAQSGKNWDPATDWKFGPPPVVTVGMLPDTTDWDALERQAKEKSKLWGTP